MPSASENPTAYPTLGINESIGGAGQLPGTARSRLAHDRKRPLPPNTMLWMGDSTKHLDEKSVTSVLPSERWWAFYGRRNSELRLLREGSQNDAAKSIVEIWRGVENRPTSLMIHGPWEDDEGRDYWKLEVGTHDEESGAIASATLIAFIRGKDRQSTFSRFSSSLRSLLCQPRG